MPMLLVCDVEQHANAAELSRSSSRISILLYTENARNGINLAPMQ